MTPSKAEIRSLSSAIYHGTDRFNQKSSHSGFRSGQPRAKASRTRFSLPPGYDLDTANIE